MATTACPKCGKPLRPGAKFCGSCGHVISTAPQPGAQPQPGPQPPATPAAAQPSPAAQPGGQPCPHCGKPLRAGAKFCNNCGKSITPSGPLPDAVPFTASAPPPAAPPQPSLSRTPAVKNSAAAAGSAASREQPAQRAPSGPVAGAPPRTPPKAAAGAPARSAPRKGLRLGIIAIASVLCVAAVVVGYFAFSQFGPKIFGTPTELAQATTEEVIDVPTDTSAPVPPTTQPVMEDTPTASATPEEVETQSEPSATPEPSMTPLPPGFEVLKEDFLNDLVAWIIWGANRPVVKRQEMPPYLELSGSSYTTSGVTSRIRVPYDAGVQIEFKASLNPRFGYAMAFFWDPADYDRKENRSGVDGGNGSTGGEPGNPTAQATTLGPSFPNSVSRASLPVGIQLEFLDGEVSLYIPDRAAEVCTTPLNTREAHVFKLQMLPGAQSGDPVKLQLLIDGVLRDKCTSEFINELTGGSISFAGHGWIYSVSVITP